MTADRVDTIPVLEVPCDECHGERRYRVSVGNGWSNCGKCNGAGYVATEFGERVIALMWHNFRPMLDAAQGEPNPL